MTAVQAKGFVLATHPEAYCKWGIGGKEAGSRCQIVVPTRTGFRGISFLHKHEAHAWIRAAWLMMDRMAEALRRRPGPEGQSEVDAR